MMRLLRPAARALARLAVPKRSAGEVLVFRDARRGWLAVPIDVLAVQAQDGSVDRRTLELVESHGTGVVFRDGSGARFAVSADIFDAARVPAHAASFLERQTERHPASPTFEHWRQGVLEFVGTANLSYDADPQDAPLPEPASLPASRPSRTTAVADLGPVRDGFRRRGWCRLTGGAFGERLGDLEQEALGFVSATTHEYELATPNRVPIYLRRRAAKGPVLQAVMHDPVVVSMLRALSGVMLVPTLGSYYFYSGNDHISIHTDASHCPYAVLVRVHGDPPPLIAFPGLLGCSQVELQGHVDRGMSGHEPEPMEFPRDGGLFFRGCELPHYRPPRAAGSEFVGVAQLCYRPLWDPIGPPNTMVAAKPVVSQPSA